MARSTRLDAGEIVSLTLDDRAIAVATFKPALFVVAVLRESTPAQLELVRELHLVLGRILSGAPDQAATPPSSSSGDGGAGGAGPAELPLIEYGITVRRERGKA